MTFKELNNKEYTQSKIKEFRETFTDLKISSLVPATYPKNLKTVCIRTKRMAQLPFDPIILSVICGTLLGDSSIAINKGYANARIQYRHSTRQTDWFMWKTLCILKEFTNDTSVCWQEPDGFQKQAPVKVKEKEKEGEILGKWKVATKVDEKLTNLYNILCPKNSPHSPDKNRNKIGESGDFENFFLSKKEKGAICVRQLGGAKKKKIQRFWLNHMNNYFLMALWLDDGSLVDQRQGIISCNNTPIKQAQILANYISTVWEVKCKVVEVASKSSPTLPQPVQIVINDLDNLEKFIKIIAPIIPVKSMLYKICLYPIKSSRLQRWTSDLKTLVRKDWHADIDLIYADLEAKCF